MEALMDAQTADKSWELGEGDEIAPGLSALKRLGGGHRYEAYLSWDDHLHAIVVVKLVRPHLVADEHTLRGLRAEIEMVERLAHPVVVRGFGSEPDGERPRLVLEHIEGPRLSTLIRRYGPLPLEQLIPLAMQLSSALHYLSQEGVVHLDLKPANIIMSGPPRLIDMSVALSTSRAAGMTRSIGTDTYMAPEQCLPQELGPVGPPADVWGLGACMFRALTGERPFPKGDDAAEGDARWPQLTHRPLLEARRDLPETVREVILQSLEFDPARRPAPGELTDRLEPVLAGQSKPKLASFKPRWS